MVRVWITTRHKERVFIGEMIKRKFEIFFYPYKKKTLAEDEYEVALPYDVYAYYVEKYKKD